MKALFKNSSKTPILITLLMFLSPLVAHAQTATSLLLLFRFYLNRTIPILIGLALLYFIWGVIQYVANGDDKERRSKARKKIVFGLIVLFVMVSVWGLVFIITNSLGLNVNARPIPQIPGGGSGPTNPSTLNAPTPIVPCGIGGGPRCQFCHLWQLAKNVIDFLMVAIIPLVGIGIAIGGFMMLASAGSEGRFSRGREIIGYAVWGLIIALIAWLIINTIIQFIANPSAFPFSGSWFGLPPCP